jgi:hypothetical protein
MAPAPARARSTPTSEDFAGSATRIRRSWSHVTIHGIGYRFRGPPVTDEGNSANTPDHESAFSASYRLRMMNGTERLTLATFATQ